MWIWSNAPYNSKSLQFSNQMLVFGERLKPEYLEKIEPGHIGSNFTKFWSLEKSLNFVSKIVYKPWYMFILLFRPTLYGILGLIYLPLVFASKIFMLNADRPHCLIYKLKYLLIFTPNFSATCICVGQDSTNFRGCIMYLHHNILFWNGTEKFQRADFTTCTCTVLLKLIFCYLYQRSNYVCGLLLVKWLPS